MMNMSYVATTNIGTDTYRTLLLQLWNVPNKLFLQTECIIDTNRHSINTPICHIKYYISNFAENTCIQ